MDIGKKNWNLLRAFRSDEQCKENTSKVSVSDGLQEITVSCVNSSLCVSAVIMRGHNKFCNSNHEQQ